jgi:hypothetical protein
MFEAISAKCLFHEVLSLQEMGTWNLGIGTNLLIFGVVNLNYSFSILGKTFFFKKIWVFFFALVGFLLKRELSFNEWSDMASASLSYSPFVKHLQKFLSIFGELS